MAREKARGSVDRSFECGSCFKIHGLRIRRDRHRNCLIATGNRFAITPTVQAICPQLQHQIVAVNKLAEMTDGQAYAAARHRAFHPRSAPDITRSVGETSEAAAGLAALMRFSTAICQSSCCCTSSGQFMMLIRRRAVAVTAWPRAQTVSAHRNASHHGSQERRGWSKRRGDGPV